MWLSTKQPVVALYTCESEFKANRSIGCAVAWTIFRSQPAFQTQLAEPTGPRSQPAPQNQLEEPGPSSQPAPQNQLEEPGPSSQPAFHTQLAETAAVGYGVVESGHLLYLSMVFIVCVLHIPINLRARARAHHHPAVIWEKRLRFHHLCLKLINKRDKNVANSTPCHMRAKESERLYEKKMMYDAGVTELSRLKKAIRRKTLKEALPLP